MRRRYQVIIAAGLVMGVIAGLLLGYKAFDAGIGSMMFDMSKQKEVLGEPEISGWVAWWKERPAYDLIATYSGRIKTVSPVWWLVDSDLKLDRVGKVDMQIATMQMKKEGVQIYPTLGSELTGKELSPLFHESEVYDQIIGELIQQTGGLDIEGLDIDLEGMAAEDRDGFVNFLSKLKENIASRGWKLSVTIQAQDGKNFWFGADGQDIAKIAAIADEVRVMVYDRHSASSGSGPIAPLSWIRDVISYNLKLIPKDKIVMGIPSYGYVWENGGQVTGMQWDEMQEYLKDKQYTGKRDETDREMEYKAADFTAWLSDAVAMKAKIELYRKYGINRFIIWHLGGLDETFFEKSELPD